MTAATLIFSGISVSAASKTAFLDGSSTSKKKITIESTNNNSGNIYATNSGANTTTQGYGKRVVSFLPDSTVASTGWMNPGNSKRVTFTQSKGKKYYGQITGQTSSSLGAVTITVN